MEWIKKYKFVEEKKFEEEKKEELIEEKFIEELIRKGKKKEVDYC